MLAGLCAELEAAEASSVFFFAKIQSIYTESNSAQIKAPERMTPAEN